MNLAEFLRQYFDECFFINLERRPDRRKDFESSYGDNFIRSAGIDGKDIDFKNPNNLPHFSAGDVGCTLSHLKTVELARKWKMGSYLVFEDDVLLHKDFKELFKSYIDEIPDDWDMIYLGANHNNTNPERISDHVVRVNGSFTTHAIAIKHTMYDALIEVWGNPVAQVDVLLASLHGKFNCYCFDPNLAGQKKGFSDILGKDVDYSFLMNK